MKPKVVLFYDHRLDQGGVETHLLGFMEQAREAVQFVIVSPVAGTFQKKAEELGAKVIAWPVVTPLSLPGLVRFIQLLRREQPDLVHIHGPNASVPGRAAAGLCKIPSLVTVHLPVTLYHGEKQTVRARAGRALYTWIDRLLNHHLTGKIIFVSDQVHRETVGAGHAPEGRSIVIPNGIALARYRCTEAGQEIRQQMRVLPDEIVVNFTGRLDRQKGVDTLLEAVHRLQGRAPAFRLWLVGDGPERAALEEQARKFGLNQPVTFWGYRENAAAIMNGSDIFVLPSRYEAMPIALIEAAAAGLACVATDVGDNRRFLEEGTAGIVIRPEDPEELASALWRLITDRTLRENLRRAAAERALGYSLEQMTARVLEIYRQMIARR